MSHPTVGAGRSILTTPLEGRPEPAAEAPRGESFREVLRQDPGEAPATPDFLRTAAQRIARGELRIEQVIRQCQRGGGISQEQLIALQATVYRYTQEIELAAKLVDKLTGAVRQTLTSQQ